MKKIILALASLTVLVGQAFAAGVLINGSQINPQTAISISTLTVTGATGLTVTSNITGPGTGLTGTAAGLTAGNVTTNANLTGNVTSVGNATTIAVIPAVSGASLTNLTAANISAGTAGISITGNAATVSGGAVPNTTTFASSVTVKSSGTYTGSLTVGTTTNILNSSAYTAIASTSNYGNGFTGCAPGSTITITTNGRPVFIAVTGDGSNPTSSGYCYLWVLQDGAYINGAVQNEGMAIERNPAVSANEYYMVSYMNLVSVTPSAGSHQYCVGVSALGSGQCNFGLATPAGFSVFEIK